VVQVETEVSWDLGRTTGLETTPAPFTTTTTPPNKLVIFYKKINKAEEASYITNAKLRRTNLENKFSRPKIKNFKCLIN
jgi:hypothetical protein